jgi:hypothetical protein
MAITQPAIKPATEQVSVVRCVQGVNPAGQVIERLTIVELALEGREGDGQLNRRMEADRAGKLFWNRQRFTQSGHHRSPLLGASSPGRPVTVRAWARQAYQRIAGCLDRPEEAALVYAETMAMPYGPGARLDMEPLLLRGQAPER